MPKQNWLFLSVFYPQREWWRLLHSGIAPFLRTNNLEAIVHFGRQRGDHLGLSCPPPSAAAGDLLREFERELTGYIQSHPAAIPADLDGTRTNAPAIPADAGDQLFMNFPPNTIYPGLHQFLPSAPEFFRSAPGSLRSSRGDPRIRRQYQAAWCRSTGPLCRVFGEAPFDREDLFSAALYLNLLLLLSDERISRNYCRNYPGRATPSPPMVQKFAGNRSLLYAILDDCRAIMDGRVSEELLPVAEWFDVFRDVRFEDTLVEDILLSTRKQLGLDEEARLLIDHFIYQLLLETIN
ncbi:hypothetical protein [Puia sp.]|jgi:hypothetical protein|uniref:hypothetical protein n=1 Tax=Puia sp. TaxID=2045100 RepID=UPI002F415FE6